MNPKQGFKQGGLVLKVQKSLPSAKKHLRIVVSKKVVKQAVKRNRIRRMLKEAVRKELGSMGKRWDLVFIVLPGFEAQNMQEARKMLHSLFVKASLFS